MTESAATRALSERLLAEMNGGLGLLLIYVGHRLGIFRALADGAEWGAADLARRTGLRERPLQEWLRAAALADYLTTDAAGERFRLPPEHVPVLADPTSPHFLGAWPGVLQGLAQVMTPLLESFRTGTGVPFAAYGEHFRAGVAETNAPLFLHEYAQRWLPCLPAVHAMLQRGARVLDVGAGSGWSSIALALAYPRSRVDAVDPDADSAREGAARAEAAGVADRVRFHACAIEDHRAEQAYDFATAFECLHDLPQPVRTLRAVRERLAPGAFLLVGEVPAGDSFAADRHAKGRLFHAISVLHCLPQSLAHPDSAALGSAIRPACIRALAREAGFSRCDPAPVPSAAFQFHLLQP